MQALLSALIAAALTFLILTLFEIVIHRLLHWQSKNYRYGVWLFTVLAGLYVYMTSLGR